MKTLITKTIVLCSVITCVPAQAHHSFSATFTDDVITVEGVVENFKFVNPHILTTFSVTDDNGVTTSWVSEGGSATAFRRRGWDGDTLNEGDFVRITGNSTRNGSPMVSMDTIVFVDPATGEVVGEPNQGDVADGDADITSIAMTLADGRPNLSGNWTRANNNRARNGSGMGGAMAGMAGGMGGGPASPQGIAEEPIFTELGATLQAAFDPVNDPQVQCEPPGIVRQAGYTPHPVRLEQKEDHVVLSYEEYGSVRMVYFDDRNLVGGEHSSLGQSIAHYEGDTLVIESTHLTANLSGSGGYALSDEATTVETYRRLPDVDGRSMLRLDMIINDPLHLAESWSQAWIKGYTHGYEFIPVECEKPL